MAKSNADNLYHRILKLPKHITQPDAYQLLGVARFEQDGKTIRQAAMDRNALLQRKQNAGNYEDVKRIEREIGEALVCLTNPELKADYDRQLESAVSLMEPPPQLAPAEERETKNLAASDEGTVEVELLPDDFIDEPDEPKLPQIPGSGIRKFPAPAASKTENESKPKAEKKTKTIDTEVPSFLPGEAPWDLSGGWWASRSPVVKGLVVGLPLLLMVGILIAIFGSRSEGESDPIAEKEELEQLEQPAAHQTPIEAANVKRLASQVLFQEESGGLEDIAMAADGRWIATLGRDGGVRLWDKFSETTRLLDVPRSAGTPLLATSLAATPDGNQLYAATGDDSLLEWTLSGLPGSIATMPKQHPIEQSVHSIEVTGDGQLVVGLGPHSNFVVFHRSTAQADAESPKHFGGLPSNVLAPRPNSDRMAVFHSDQTIRLWKPNDAASQPDRLLNQAMTQPEFALAYTPDGAHLAAANADRHIRLYDLNAPDAKPIEFKGHSDRIYSLSFSPNAKLLASTGADRTVRLWDVTTGNELARLGGHKQSILSVAFSGSGDAFYTASRDGTVRRWSVGESAVPPAPILPADISSPASKNPPSITNALANRLVPMREFSLSAPKSLSSSALNGAISFHSGAVSPDGSRIACRFSTGPLLICDAQTGRPRHYLPVDTHNNIPGYFSADGQTFFAVQNDGWLSSWDMATGRMVNRVSHSTLYSSFQAMAVSRKANRLAVRDGIRGVKVHTDFNDLSQSMPLTINATCRNVCFTPDGQDLAVHGERRVEIWNLGAPAGPLNPNRIGTLNLSTYGGVTAMALSPDLKTCVLGKSYGKLLVYSVEDGNEIASFTAHSGPIHSLAFDPEGKMLFSAGGDSDVRIWNPLAWGSQLARLPKPGRVSSATPVLSYSGSSGLEGSQPPIALSQNSDPVTSFQLLNEARQLVVLHKSGSGVVWEVGEKLNPEVAASPAPNDLRVSGPPQPLGANNIAALTKWDEFTAHRHTVTHLQFTPDQKCLLTAGVDGAIRFWDVQTGALHHVLTLTGSASSTAYTPSAMPPEGSPLGIGQGGYPGGLPATPLMTVGAGTTTIQHIAVSQTNLMAATIDGRIIHLWNTDTGNGQGTLGNGTDRYTWFDFTPDGNTLIAQAGINALQFWNLSDRKPPATQTAPSDITAADACPISGPYLFATGNSRGEIRLWKSPTEHTSTQGNQRAIQALKFSPDGKHLAAWDQSQTVQIWDLATNTKVAQHQWPGFIPNDMQFTPKSDALLVISDKGSLRGLAVDPDKSALVNQTTLLAEGNRFAIAPRGELLALTRTETGPTASQLGKVQLWGVGGKPSGLSPRGYMQTPLVTPQATAYVHPKAITRERVTSVTELKQFPAHEKDVWSLDYLPDGSAFVSGGTDTMAYVWDAFSHQKIHTLQGHTNRVVAVAASPDNQHIATASVKGTVILWDRFTGREVLSREAHKNPVLDLEFSSAGDYLATASQDRTIKIWTARTLTERNKLSGHTNSVTGLTWLTDSELVSVGRDNNVYLWNPLKGKLGDIPGHGTAMEGVASTKGRKIAFASSRGTVGLFTNVLKDEKGKETWSRLSGHKGPVQAVAFSPDESLLVSLGTDMTLKFWNTDNGTLLHTLTGPEKKIHCLCFSPDGRWLITGDTDGIIRIWGLK